MEFELRTVDVQIIAEAVRDAALDVNRSLSEGHAEMLRAAISRETSPLSRQILERIVENVAEAETTGLPSCQDTGTAVVFIDLGQDVALIGGDLEKVINSAVAEAYDKGQLRKSMRDPLTGANTGDNTPAVIHARIVSGDKITVSFMAKGGGCENVSKLAMLRPADGEDGIVEFVVQTLKDAGGATCPPVTLGIGLGGNFEEVALLAKRALLRHPAGTPAVREDVAALERRILQEVNATGIGPMGMGGDVTALAVHIDIAPAHIASLPIAVNIDCHAHRCHTVVI